MAEVDIIKLWNKGKAPSSDAESFDIDEVISRKSKTPLFWIKLVLWIEFWINFVSLPFFYVYRDLDPVLYGIVTPILIVIYLVYYQFLIRKIKAFDFTDNVRSGLRKLYGYLNFFFLHYKVVIWVVFPIVYAYQIYVAIQNIPHKMSTKSILATIGIGIVVCAVVALLINFLINLIYGRKIKRLRGIVQELDQED